MLLSVLERMMLQGLLPEQGNFANLKILRVARESLSFNDEETKRLAIKQEGDQTRWTQFVVIDKKTGNQVAVDAKILEKDPEFLQKMANNQPELYEMVSAVEDTDIPIGEIATQMIVDALKELDKKKELKGDHFSLYEKFIDPGPKEPVLEVVKDLPKAEEDKPEPEVEEECTDETEPNKPAPPMPG